MYVITGTILFEHFLPSLSSAVPSAPLSVISSINETSVSLEWAEPRDSGGRADLVYNVVCKKCEHGACVRCDDNVEVAPRRLGLAERHAAVRNLQAHTHYSFEIQAVNGVSPKSPVTPRYATVNITTNQAGEDQLVSSSIFLSINLVYIYKNDDIMTPQASAGLLHFF